MKQLIVKANKVGKVMCPFCNEYHTHGKAGGNGHRLPHCSSAKVESIVFIDGESYLKDEGYRVEFIA
jgi:hypothetical protein